MTPEERKQVVELAQVALKHHPPNDDGRVMVDLAHAVLALAEDADRLDWLDRWFFDDVGEDSIAYRRYYKSAREAIDARRKGKGWQ